MSASPEMRVAGTEDPALAGPASRADRAILRTVTYAALFQSPLTLEELHRGLMDVRMDLPELRRRLGSARLSALLEFRDGWLYPCGRGEWVEQRALRERRTRELLERHRQLLRRLAAFPYVRLLALSGACAHDNATDDDVDVFLVVERGRAWAVCLALMILSKAAGLRRTLCLNYIVDEAALILPQRDLYTAAEIVGMKPLAGPEAYARFVQANAWLAPLFPNFSASYESLAAAAPPAGAPAWLERVLDCGPAPLAEAVARLVLRPYLARKARGCAGVVLDRHRLKLHLRDHRGEIEAAFSAAVSGEGEAREATA